MGRPRGKKVKRRHMMMSDEDIRQIDELARAFSKNRSQIVRLAIARWHRVEFLQAFSAKKEEP